MSTGDRIKNLRQSLSLSQDELGERIGIKKSAISLIENEKSNPTEQTIKMICREFGVSYDWLTQGLEPMYVPEESSVVQSLYQIMHGDNEFMKRTMREFAKMPREAWLELEAFIDRLAGKE